MLFYSQSNQVLRVKAARNEIRGLLLARNEFATYLHRRMTLSVNGWPGSTQSQTEVKREPDSTPKVKAEPDDETALWGGADEEAALWGDEEVVEPDEDRPLLPAPIDDERLCKRCFAVDACMLFRRVS